MTDEELRTLVGSLAVSTASNTEAITKQAESIRELRATVESQERAIREVTEGLVSLRASAESQAQSIESTRESLSYNTDAMATALEISAISQRTAAAAQEVVAQVLQLQAGTTRNLDLLRLDIADLQQIVGIVIRDNQADRLRFGRLEGQN
jgi:hypothetical protein